MPKRKASTQKKDKRRRDFAAKGALAVGIAGAVALLIWAIVNPRHLAQSVLYLIYVADYLAGLALVIGLLVRVSAGQPLDNPTAPQHVEWESDFQSWNTSQGLWIFATEQQLHVLRQLFALGNCIDNSITPPRLDPERRREFISLLQSASPQSGSPLSNIDSKVLFSALQTSDRHYVIAILKGLRQIGDASVVPRLFGTPDQERKLTPGLHFEEIRCTAPQCINVLAALSILQSDRDLLLRASSADSQVEHELLLRPTVAAVNENPEELLRGVNGAE